MGTSIEATGLGWANTGPPTLPCWREAQLLLPLLPPLWSPPPLIAIIAQRMGARPTVLLHRHCRVLSVIPLPSATALLGPCSCC